jgi:two-component system, LuxR family, response regulator FixJ
MQRSISIVDEDEGVATAIAALLEAQGYRPTTFRDADKFLAAQEAVACAAVMVSLELPNHGAYRILETLAEQAAQPPVIVTTYGARAPQIVEAMRMGATDVLEKPFNTDALVELIQQAGSTTATAGPPQDTPDLLEKALTNEEREILALLEQGAMIKEIAAKLDISVRTVHYRKASILEKTGCRNRSEVVSKLSSLRSVRNRPLQPANRGVSRNAHF